MMMGVSELVGAIDAGGVGVKVAVVVAMLVGAALHPASRTMISI